MQFIGKSYVWLVTGRPRTSLMEPPGTEQGYVCGEERSHAKGLRSVHARHGRALDTPPPPLPPRFQPNQRLRTLRCRRADTPAPPTAPLLPQPSHSIPSSPHSPFERAVHARLRSGPASPGSARLQSLLQLGFPLCRARLRDGGSGNEQSRKGVCSRPPGALIEVPRCSSVFASRPLLGQPRLTFPRHSQRTPRGRPCSSLMPCPVVAALATSTGPAAGLLRLSPHPRPRLCVLAARSPHPSPSGPRPLHCLSVCLAAALFLAHLPTALRCLSHSPHHSGYCLPLAEPQLPVRSGRRGSPLSLRSWPEPG
ncbi:hypothetical protein NN561_006021 [Cricetulus griseus]